MILYLVASHGEFNPQWLNMEIKCPEWVEQHSLLEAEEIPLYNGIRHKLI